MVNLGMSPSEYEALTIHERNAIAKAANKRRQK